MSLDTIAFLHLFCLCFQSQRAIPSRSNCSCRQTIKSVAHCVLASTSAPKLTARYPVFVHTPKRKRKDGVRAYWIYKEITQVTQSEGHVPKLICLEHTHLLNLSRSISAASRKRATHQSRAAAGCAHPGLIISCYGRQSGLGGWFVGYVRDLKDVHCWQLSPAGAFWVLITLRMHVLCQTALALWHWT